MAWLYHVSSYIQIETTITCQTICFIGLKPIIWANHRGPIMRAQQTINARVILGTCSCVTIGHLDPALEAIKHWQKYTFCARTLEMNIFVVVYSNSRDLARVWWNKFSRQKLFWGEGSLVGEGCTSRGRPYTTWWCLVKLKFAYLYI